MHIAVCVKQVPHPDTPASQFRIDEAARRVLPVAGVPLVMSPFDEQAVEAALRLREAVPSTRITAITLGEEIARNVLKHALAMGADDAVLLCDSAFDGGDGYTTALALAAAVRKLGTVELVLAGRQAADDDAGVVGAGLAHCLDAPLVCFAKRIERSAGGVAVERVLDDGTEIVEAPLPAVITVSNELGEPRKPTLRETMRAARKPIAAWCAADLGLGARTVGAAGARAIVERVYAPEKSVRCEMIDAGNVNERAALLMRRLRAARVI